MRNRLRLLLHERIVPRLQRFAETPFPALVIHFFHRFFDSEIVSGGGDNSLSVGGVFGLLAVPGLLMPLFLLEKYSSLELYLRHQRPPNPYLVSIPEKYLFIVFSMAVTGVVSILKWDSLFPDRRDFANLAPLPLSPRRILSAKALALALLMLLFVFDLNFASSIVFPFIVMAELGTFGGLVHWTIIHIVSVAAASAFTFLSLVALIGVLMSVLPGPAFRVASRWLRAVLIALVLGMLFSAFEVTDRLGHLQPDSWLTLLPPVWFVALYQKLQHHGTPAFDALAGLSLRALGLSAGLAAAAYLASYRRVFLRIAESLDSPSSRNARTRWDIPSRMAAWFLRTPFERACFSFATQTLARSERHWLMLGAYAGCGAAVASQSLVAGSSMPVSAGPSPQLLAAPLALVFFVLCGLRFLFDVPAELRANWIFQVCGRGTVEEAARAARLLMLGAVLPALVGICLPFYWIRYGAQDALLATGLDVLISVVLARGLLFGYRKIPFTCAWLPGKRNPAAALFAFLLAFYAFVFVMSDLELWMLGAPLRALPVAAGAGVLYYAIHHYDAEGRQDGSLVVFEEWREPAVTVLGLS